MRTENARLYEYHGEMVSLQRACDLGGVGVTHQSAYYRLHIRVPPMTVEQAVETPLKEHYRRFNVVRSRQ